MVSWSTVDGGRRAAFRLGAAGGIAGPAAFTDAWIASSLRQTRQGPGGLQLSGLAAADARDPWIMLAGFLVLGGCTFAFGAALREALTRNATGGAGPGPALVQGAGLLTAAAGLLRRDHMRCSTRPASRTRRGITTRMTRSAACSTPAWSSRSSRWHGGSAATLRGGPGAMAAGQRRRDRHHPHRVHRGRDRTRGGHPAGGRGGGARAGRRGTV